MLRPHIKLKSKLWKFIPWFTDFTANAIYPNIYLPKKVYENLKSKNPKPKYMVALIHEETHLQRERQMGWLKFGIKYLFLSKFRFNEEMIAIKAAIKYQKKNNLSFDIEKTAKYLSGWLYLWPVSYKEARIELEKAWEEV